MILLVGLLIAGTICLGVSLKAYHWSNTHYTPLEKDSKGNYILTTNDGKRANMGKDGADYVNRPSKDAFKAGTVFLVIAAGFYTGAYVVFTRVIKRKRE